MKLVLALSILASAAMAVPATAGIVYMTGAGDPWGVSTNEAAMDAAFGAGNWTKIQGFTATAFTGNSFIFMDGGDAQADEFGNFLVANGAAFSSFLSTGGSALVHVAPNQNQFPNYALPNGLTISYPNFSGNASLTAAGVAAGLGGGGAGANFTGTSFSHSSVSGGTCLITGDAGCILAQAGALLAGGETTTNFHQGGDPFQLRVNELRLAAGAAIPEPASWALMIVGFGLVGLSMRRRAAAVA